MFEGVKGTDPRAAPEPRQRKPAHPTDAQANAAAAIAAAYPPIARVFDGSAPIVIAAAARMGRAFLSSLRGQGVSPVAFADNDRTKWGTEIEGVPVMAPEDAIARYPNAAVCVATVISESELLGQMRGLGFPLVYPLSFLHHNRPDVFVAPYLDGAFESCFDPAHAETIAEVGALWADAESASTFENILAARRTLDLGRYGAILADHPQYFPPTIVSFTPDDVICDGGAYTGDTLASFRQLFPDLRIPYYGFEPDPTNYAQLAATGKEYGGRFVPVQAGLGAREATMGFAATGAMDGQFSAGASGPTISVHTIDRFFSHETPPTFIKMDIEGMEPLALAGAANTIRSHAPTLAICVYHEPAHLWDIPRWVHDQQPGYRFYLRHYSRNMSETVMYAVAG